MIRRLLMKWFNLEETPCETCEVLRTQLAESTRERKELLARLLDKPKDEPPHEQTEPLLPITPQVVPWRVRQQMLESEDRKSAELMRARRKEIEELEKELDIPVDSYK